MNAAEGFPDQGIVTDDYEDEAPEGAPEAGETPAAEASEDAEAKPAAAE